MLFDKFLGSFNVKKYLAVFCTDILFVVMLHHLTLLYPEVQKKNSLVLVDNIITFDGSLKVVFLHSLRLDHFNFTVLL